MKREVKIALIQMSCQGTREENLEKALRMIDEAAENGARIVALPEIFLGEYFCQKPDDKEAFERAEKIPGPTTEALSEAAKKYGIVLIGGSIFEKKDESFYNTAPVFMADGELAGVYRKTHIPEDILYHEQHYFKSSDEGVKIFDTPFGKIAVLICYDQWFPEFARLAVLKGAEIIFYPTAIGVIDEDVEENITGDWQKMWTNAQVGHSAVNNVIVCAINRVGKEGAINFWGGSFVTDAASRIVAQGGDKEEIVYATVDVGKVKALQKAWRFLECRKPQQYKDLSA